VDAAVVRPLAITTARVARDFAVFDQFTRVKLLAVRGAKRGMRIELRCRGRSCPSALRPNRVRRVTVRRAGTVSFTRTFRGARLRPGVVIEVRATETGAIGRIDRFHDPQPKAPIAHPALPDIGCATGAALPADIAGSRLPFKLAG
jgi:hypothetical protein